MNTENLNDSLLVEIESYAVNIAHQAGQILRQQFRQPLEVQFKGEKKNDPVTSADHLSEEYLKKAINDKFPSHNILSEEGGTLQKSDSSFVWVLDPLDGTANYLNGLPLFAVSIGVLWKGQPVVGSIYVPVSHHGAEGVYHTRLGQGAFLNEEKIEIGLNPSSHPLAEIPVGFGNRFRLSGRSKKEKYEARNLGSIALEIAMTASGVFQYAVFGSPKIWDIAAGVLLIKEAGGSSFIKKPGDKSWQTLGKFELVPNNRPETLEDLRTWSFPLVAGSTDAAGKIAKDIQIRRKPLASLFARFRSQNRDRKQTGKGSA